MGLFLRPRRPLLRVAAGAATAGIAYQGRPAPGRAGRLTTSRPRRPTRPPRRPRHRTPPAYAPAPAAAPPPDSIAELERLARLHESGALTDEEFTAAKARALGL